MSHADKPADPGTRPPVERLSDIAWARIEREMWTRLDGESLPAAARGRRYWMWIAAPLAAAAAVTVFVVMSQPAVPEVTTGNARISRISRIVAGESPSTISFNAGHITLDAETAIVLDSDGQKPTSVIERGGAWFSVTPRAGRPPFVVVAGDAIVRVVGTRFKVSRANERVAVVVEHGSVQVTFRGDEVEVDANHQWSSERPSLVTAIATSETTSTTAERVARTPDPVMDPDADPDAVSVPVPVEDVQRRRDTVETSPRASAGLAVPSRSAPIDDDTRFKQLGALEPRDPSTAIAGYLELAQRPRYAKVALFAAGRLAADRKDRRATSLLENYLRRFPGGANAADARQLLGRLRSTDRAKGDAR